MTDQEKAFEKLSKLKVGALFMEMGTGKTKVALDLIASKKEKVDYILWICPFSIKSEILVEKNKWHPELEIEVVGCESIGSSDRIYIELLNKIENSKAFIVVDESLKIKNSAAKRTQRITSIGKKAKYKLILNGTPISKNILDLYAQMEFLSHKILKMNFWEFKNTFCVYETQGYQRGDVIRQTNIPYLISLIQPYVFDSKLELSARKNYHNKNFFLTSNEIAKYEKIKEKILDEMEDDDEIQYYRLISILQEFYSSTESANNKLKELLNEIDGQVLVFCKYLKNIPDNYDKIIGDISEKKRKEIIEKFKNKEIQILFVTYGCGAYGLNFQNCQNIIFRDQTWDYAQREQAENRIYRFGQDKDVHYYDMIAEIGLEKIIKKNQGKKIGLLNEVKKEITKRGLKDWLKDM